MRDLTRQTCYIHEDINIGVIDIPVSYVGC